MRSPNEFIVQFRIIAKIPVGRGGEKISEIIEIGLNCIGGKPCFPLKHAKNTVFK